MSSDTFLQVQKALREFKYSHDIDLAHPAGAKIHGKIYPAGKKSLWLDSQRADYSSGFDFVIPFENRHRAEIMNHQYHETPPPGQLSNGRISVAKTHPMTWITDNSEDQIHTYGTGYGANDTHNSRIKYTNAKDFLDNADNFHRTMSEWSQEPTKGSFFPYQSRPPDDEYAMNDEELQKHAQLYPKDRFTPPHLIDVWRATRVDGEGLMQKRHTYNVKTEELTPNPSLQVDFD